MTNEEIIRQAQCILYDLERSGSFSPEDISILSSAIGIGRIALRTLQDAKQNPGEISDGYHTFNELYHHRAVLFSVICNSFPELAWKSKRHATGDMYDGMFIVGIKTPDGQATYHYDIDPYWDMFHVPELPNAHEWDGHTPAEAIRRIGLLGQQSNEPLTLRQLRQMDGEPVFTIHGQIRRWSLVDADMEQVRNANGFVKYFSSYGKEWVAYRNKPEGA